VGNIKRFNQGVIMLNNQSQLEKMEGDILPMNGADIVFPLLTSATTTGAGTAQKMMGGRCTFQAVANGTSGAFATTVLVQVSNDNVNFITLGAISLSGTATTAATDGFATTAPWRYVVGNVSAISGTGANVTLTMGF
jgi:hypothetical protein